MDNTEEQIQIKNETLTLDPGKVIYWESRSALLISDLHLGKGGHFRKNGLPVPQLIETELHQLGILINKYLPSDIFMLGDLFHASFNSEWEYFSKWRKKFKNIKFHLIKGNHDILPDELIKGSKVEIYQELELNPFTLSHIPVPESIADPAKFYVSGHVHPAVRLVGRANQSITFPCFYFSEFQGILPAFGKLTGLYKIKPSRSDKIFIIFNNKVKKLI